MRMRMMSLGRDFQSADACGGLAVYEFAEQSENAAVWLIVIAVVGALLFWPATIHTSDFLHTTTAVPDAVAHAPGPGGGANSAFAAWVHRLGGGRES
jgi:hypothetical protein